MSLDLKIKALVDKLTKAQRAYLTDKAEWRDPTGYYGHRWMTFPPSNTHRVLMRLGLVDGSGMLTRLGLQVRTYLMLGAL